jgi:hypothetical protein
VIEAEEPEDQEEGDPALENADDGEHQPEPVLVGEPRRPRPTANLLGWSPAERLTDEQRQALEDSGLGRNFQQITPGSCSIMDCLRPLPYE